MGTTFTARQGYKGRVAIDGDVLQFIGVPTIAGVERNAIDITALGDGFAPFPSFHPGMYGPMSVSGQIAYDSANDGCAEVLAHFPAASTAELVLRASANATGTVLLTGSCRVIKCTPIFDKADITKLDVTCQWTGTMTGALCAGAA
jgi:hypothetical protein